MGKGSVEGSDREGRRPLRGYAAAWGEEAGWGFGSHGGEG